VRSQKTRKTRLYWLGEELSVRTMHASPGGVVRARREMNHAASDSPADEGRRN
jgi:hypothetical protein